MDIMCVATVAIPLGPIGLSVACHIHVLGFSMFIKSSFMNLKSGAEATYSNLISDSKH